MPFNKNKTLIILSTIIAALLAIFLVTTFIRSKATSWPVSFGSYVLSPDTQFCVVQLAGDNAPIGIVNASGTGPLKLLNGTEGGSEPAWNSESNGIYYTVVDAPNSVDSLPMIKFYRLNQTGLPYILIQSKTTGITTPTPSPDGRYLAYVAVSASGPSLMHIHNLVTNNDLTINNFPVTNSKSLLWNAGSHSISFIGNDMSGHKKNLIVCSEAAKFAPQPTGIECEYYSFSPQSDKISFLGPRNDRGEFITLIVQGLPPRSIATFDRPQIAPHTQWSNDGKSLFFIDHLRSNPEICQLDIASGKISILIPRGTSKRLAIVGVDKNQLIYSKSYNSGSGLSRVSI